jgi:peptidyl-Asp metalloendopeptidase
MFRVFPHSLSVPALACALGLTLSACMEETGPGASRPDPVERDLPRLFAASPAGLEPAKAYPEEIRARLNAVEPSLLADGGAALAGAARFELNLFDDASFTAEVDRSESQGPGRFTLNGHLAGVEGGYFILTYADGMVSVTAYDPERGYYEMEPAGDGVVKVSEFLPGKLPRVTHGMLWPDGMPMDHGSMDMPPEAMPKAAAGPSVIDILVVYTAAASAGAGGDAAIRTRIDKAVAEANTAFLNSQVNAKLNLVRAEQVNYAESGNLGTDLTRLQNKTDGYMDQVHALRETYKADLVSLVVEKTSGGVAGIGYVMTSVSSYFKGYAFTAIARQYTGAYNTLAHEVGHNLGCAHDRQNSTSQAAYPYSYGYRFYANGVQYRTIMAYYPGQGIPYYSNPNVSYLGVPTGIPGGQANAADNARTINNTSPTAMNFYAGAAIQPVAKAASR